MGAGACAGTWTVPDKTFVQDVAFHPTDGSLFVVATTGKALLLYDVRQPPSAAPMQLENDVMVNTAVVLPSSPHVLSGDKHGALRTWDLRTGCCVASFLPSE
eukprot:2606540-Prymnesium_polylepis.1